MKPLTGARVVREEVVRNDCTYKSEFTTEHYCKLIMHHRHSAVYCNFHCGVPLFEFKLADSKTRK